MTAINDAFGNLMLNTQLRLRLLVALALVVLLLPNIDPHWFWPGLVVSIAGLIAELWVLGSVRSRRKFPMDGLYTLVRHPSHLTRFLLVLGLVLMTGVPWLLPAYIALYLFYTMYGAQQEELDLEERFGAEYIKYSRHVPSFIPHLKPYEEGRLWFFSMKSFQRQYGEIVLVVFAVLYIFCYVVAFHLK